MSNEAAVYICYHPGALNRLAQMSRVCRKNRFSLLLVCGHPYVNTRIIENYAASFDHVIVFPDIRLELNFIRLASGLRAYRRIFAHLVRPVLKRFNAFHVVSNASSYLPVNILISWLRKEKKCGYSLSICDEIVYKTDIDILRSVYALLITMILRLNPVYYNRKVSFLYLHYPIDRIVKFHSPFNAHPGVPAGRIRSIPVYHVCEAFEKRLPAKRDTVVIYGDTTVLEAYRCDLALPEYEKRLREFFSRLAAHYRGCELIYKPHPLDRGKVMPGLEGVCFQRYEGDLISQLHLDMIADRVKACYSVCSVSLRYSASKGIPSYSCYNLLGFNGDYPRAFFEDPAVFDNPYLFTIRSIDEIGAIDGIEVEPACRDDSLEWERLFV